MLHKSATTLSNGTRVGVADARSLANQSCTLSEKTGGIVIGTQLWSRASRHASCAAGHQRNKWSISSLVALQRAQIGLI